MSIWLRQQSLIHIPDSSSKTLLVSFLISCVHYHESADTVISVCYWGKNDLFSANKSVMFLCKKKKKHAHFPLTSLNERFWSLAKKKKKTNLTHKIIIVLYVLKEIICFAAVSIGSRKEALCAPTAVQVSKYLVYSKSLGGKSKPRAFGDTAAELTWQQFRLNQQSTAEIRISLVAH